MWRGGRVVKTIPDHLVMLMILIMVVVMVEMLISSRMLVCKGAEKNLNGVKKGLREVKGLIYGRAECKVMVMKAS